MNETTVSDSVTHDTEEPICIKNAVVDMETEEFQNK